MTVVARKFVASPVRSASDVWTAIVDRLAPSESSEARDELLDVAGIASSIIASEAVKESPVVIWGNGPRVRIYCLYGEDAVTGEDASESALTFCPTDGEWNMSLPCLDEDLQWVQTALASRTKKVTARDLIEKSPESDANSTNAAQKLTVTDKEAFFRL